MGNVFLTFRGPYDRQRIFRKCIQNKEGKKGKRYKAPEMVKASDKCGQVSAGTYCLSKIYTSFWITPQPLGMQSRPCRCLLTARDSKLPRLLGFCYPMDHL